MVSDFCYGSKLRSCDTGVFESVFADFLNVSAEFDGGKRNAVCKRAVTYNQPRVFFGRSVRAFFRNFKICGKFYKRKITATAERVRADFEISFRNKDLFKPFGTPEPVIRNGDNLLSVKLRRKSNYRG